MTKTTVPHRLVTDYLRQFDADAAILPVQRARELREQLVAHIEEALGPEASDQEIAAVLDSLGSTRLLVTDAAATAGRRWWAARIGWRRWIVIGVLVLVATAICGYYVRVDSVGSLSVEGSAGWWYPQDAIRGSWTEADNASQSTVPIRSGQRQGFYVQLFNFTGMTQTVLGSTLDNGPNAGTSVQVTVSTSDGAASGYDAHTLRYGLPVAIPPGQTRFLRITWISRYCLPRGQDAGMDSVGLRVRVGWTTRTEEIQFDEGFYLGTAGHCAS